MSRSPLSFGRRVYRRLRREFDHWQLRYRREFVPALVKLRYRLPAVELASIASEEVEMVPPILDDVCMSPYSQLPDYYPKYEGYDDLSVLMRIVGTMQPRTVVEFGTAYGNTVANICRQCPHARVYTVNAPAEEQTGEIVTYQLSTAEIGRVYRDHSFSERVVQIFKNTLELDLSEHIAAPVVDLAIIDACHDTEYVMNDFFKVKHLVRPGGMVLFHDTHPGMAEHLLGSYMGCMKLRKQGYDIRHINRSWWGIWINGGFGPLESLLH